MHTISLFPNKGLNLHPCNGNTYSKPLDSQASPEISFSFEGLHNACVCLYMKLASFKIFLFIFLTAVDAKVTLTDLIM